MTAVGITLDGRGEGHVTLDGQDVSSAVQGLTVNANAHEGTTVILRLSGRAQLQAEAGVRVEISPALAIALKAAGWRAPDTRPYVEGGADRG